jgi:hypothetical protein
VTVRPDAQSGGEVAVNYLATGLSWAPAYRAKLGDDGRLSLEQQAVVKNDLSDLSGTELSLISGYPSVHFAAVTSPLAVSQSWDDFFRQLAAADTPDYGGMGSVASNSGVQSQSASGGNDRTRGLDGAAPAGESNDVHYQSIGHRTLARGDALMTSVATASAPFTRIVLWRVVDPRTGADGYRRYGFGRSEPVADEAWDAVRFDNPFAFPMTTGPFVVVDHGHFAAQAVSTWTNPGEPDTVKMTKALSVSIHATLAEAGGVARSTVYEGAARFNRLTLDGELTFANRRSTPVTLEIVRDVPGEVVSADGHPDQRPQEDAADPVQRHFTLRWTVQLKSGENGSLKYRYTTLEPN